RGYPKGKLAVGAFSFGYFIFGHAKKSNSLQQERNLCLNKRDIQNELIIYDASKAQHDKSLFAAKAAPTLLAIRL
ncbi:MAG: hypothetical protein KJP10_08765, partial [Gammaproteobacteria bacterium]|nr:hypothetical protein [Gammaproteobacteria bacterium]